MTSFAVQGLCILTLDDNNLKDNKTVIYSTVGNALTRDKYFIQPHIKEPNRHFKTVLY